MFVYLYSLYSRYKFEVLVLDAWVLVLVSVPKGSVLDTPLILSRPRPRPVPLGISRTSRVRITVSVRVRFRGFGYYLVIILVVLQRHFFCEFASLREIIS